MSIKNLLTGCAFLFLTLRLDAQTAYPLCEEPIRAFQSGETLRYTLYYNWNFVWIPAGTLVLQVNETKATYEIVATGKTLDSYEWFFRVDDHYECTLNKDDFLPIRYERNIREGNYSLINTIEFDYEKGVIRSTVSKNERSPSHYTFPLDSCTLDLLSMIYKLRNIDMDHLISVPVFESKLIFDEKVYTIPVRYLGMEAGKLIPGLGRFDLYKISPDLITGHVFSEGSQMIIWVSLDKNRIPMLIEAPIKVGHIKAILRQYDNLKYPINKHK